MYVCIQDNICMYITIMICIHTLEKLQVNEKKKSLSIDTSKEWTQRDSQIESSAICRYQNWPIHGLKKQKKI